MVVGGPIVTKNTLKRVTKIIMTTLVLVLIAIAIVIGLLVKNTSPKVKAQSIDENFTNKMKSEKHTTEETLKRTTIVIELRHIDKLNNESVNERDVNVNITNLTLTSPSTTQIMKGRLILVKLGSDFRLPHPTHPMRDGICNTTVLRSMPDS